jgi:hypothetical protein
MDGREYIDLCLGDTGASGANAAREIIRDLR